MAGVPKLELYWSPNSSDKFLSWGAEISLYQVETFSPKDHISQSQSIQLSPNFKASLIGSFSDVTFAKCLAWLPNPELEGFLAIGHSTGRILLASILGVPDTCNLNGKEYVSKHNRSCNTLAWSHMDPQTLAAGFDKHRSEHGLAVWDVQKSGGDFSKPIVEASFGDTVSSVAWFNNSRTLVAGVNNKQLRLYDLKDGSKALSITNTRAVQGISMDPFVTHRIASFSDSSVCVWDVRNFEKPVLSLQQSKPISKISWSPTHLSFLGVLCKESNVLSLYDIQNANGGSTEEMEPTPLERGLMLTDSSEHISSFAWFPNEENRLIYSTSSLIIKDHVVVDRITLNWSPASKLVWNCGKRILQYIDEKDLIYDRFEDVSVIMRQRAMRCYGLEPDFKPESELMQDPSTRGLWSWVDTCRKLMLVNNSLGQHFLGVRSALRIEQQDYQLRSDHLLIPWNGMDGTKTSPVTVYKSEERCQALRLCGWPHDTEDSTLGALLDKLVVNGQTTRAAALAVFHLKIRKAIKILTQKGQQKNDTSYQLVALALAGFTDNRDTLWQEMCSSQRSSISDPYLRAAFAFLTCSSEKYDAVMNEKGMIVRDRIGFACTFLSDSHLTEYVEQLSRQLVKEGNLDGMLLTGMTTDGLCLLQSYVDKTGDIQTVSLLSLHTSNQETNKDPRMQQWINSYRSLLDSWRLWTQRARFDVQYYKRHPSGVEKPPPQVYVSCNYCGKSISVFSGGKAKMSSSRSNPNAKFKLSGCPNCRNPLPRCALCMMHLGSPLASWGGPTDRTVKKPAGSVEMSKSHPFASWILWCQTCRHGGHSAHLLDWFGEHSECPVTGCSCRCLNLDAIGHHIPVIANGTQ